MPERSRRHAADQVPFRLWAPARFRALVSVVAAAAAGLIPAVALQPRPAYADPGDIIIEADIEGVEGGEFAFEVYRLGPTSAPITIKYDIIPAGGDGFGAATAGTDYTAISGETTFAASSRSVIKRLVVNGVNDPNDEVDAERFALRLRYLDDTLVTPIAYGTMLDDDAPPTYTLDASPLTVAEDAGNATITATLSNFSHKEVQIPYGTTPGTAAATDDYTTTSGTLVIPPESPTGTFTVPIINDVRDETSPESFTVNTTGSPVNATAGSPDTTTVEITDNDAPPTVSVDPVVPVAEGENAVFTIRLNAASNLAVDVTAAIAGGGGATGSGTDFTADATQTVTIPAGQTTATVTVATATDANSESGESVDLTISNPVNATLGTATRSIGIVDNALTVTADTAISEGNSGTRNQMFTVSLPVAPQTSTPVSFSVTNGTATGGSDFTAATGTLTFGPGVQTQQITVPILGDETYEAGGETFNIVLSDPGTSVLSGFGSTTFTIVEDDTAPALVSVSNVARLEGSGTNTATFVATIDHPSKDPITLGVGMTDTGNIESAGAGAGSDDYDLDNVSLSIPAGSTSGEVTVTVKGDAVYETEESATVTVTASGGGVTAGTATGLLTLQNDDTVPTISLGGVNGNEGATNVALSATVTGSAEMELPFTASATGASDGSSDAAESADFTATNLTASGALAAGASSLALGSIDLTGSDGIDEHAETVRIAVTMDGSTVSDYVTINDSATDLPPRVAITPTVSVAENNGPALVGVALDYNHGGNTATQTGKTINVAYSATAGGTAAAGDFAVGTGTVSFTGAETSKNISVGLTNDSDYELSETFNVALTSAPNADSITAPNSTVTITNDDTAPAFTVIPDATSTPLTVAEGGTASFTVRLAAPAVATVDMTAAMSNGTTAGTDYTAPAATFTIGAGQQEVTVEVPAVDDAVDEANETATLTIARDGSETDATGGPVASLISITDNDAAPTLALAPITGAEGTSQAITATVTGEAQAEIAYTATVTGVGGTAAAQGLTNPVQSADINGTGLTLSGNLAPGASTLSLGNLALLNDVIDEDNQTAQVSIALAGQAPVTTTVTVTDNADDLPPQVAIGSTLSVAENAGPALVPVTLNYGHGTNTATETEKTIQVAYEATAGGSAAAGDFAVGTGSVSFTGAETSKNISVGLTNDTDYELSETFNVGLTGATNAGTITQPSSVVTITNDDAAPGFSVIPDATSTPLVVAENGTAEFTVRLAAPAADTVSMTATMANVSTAGDDYTAPTVNFSIPAGQQEVTVSVPIVDDAVDELAETATLTIARAAMEADATGDPVVSQISITDNDAAPTLSLAPITGAEGTSEAITATVTGTAQAQIAYTATVTGVGGTAAAQGLTNPVSAADVNGGSLTLSGNLAAGASTLSLGNLGLLNDAIDEDNQTAQVSIALAGQAPVTTTVTVTDNADDLPPQVAIGSTLSVAEDVGSAQVPVTLNYGHGTNTATETEKTIQVAYETTAGGSASSADFTVGTGSISFTGAETSKNIAVPVVNDTDYELSETFNVGLTGATNAGTITQASSTVTITDNDTAPGFTVIPDATVDALTVAENGTASFTVRLAAPAVATIDMTAAMSNGTTANTDYTAPPATFTISAGQQEAIVEVPIVDDTVDEAAETATLTIARDSGETAATGGPVASLISITDNDAAPALALSPITGAEGTTPAITATVTGSSQAPIAYTATVTGVGGTAAAQGLTNPVSPADVNGAGLTLSGNLAAGAGTLSLGNLGLSDDLIDEDNQTAQVSIALAGQEPVTTTVTITDNADDLPPEASIAPTVSVAENGGPAPVPVTLNFNHDGNNATSSEKTIVVNYDATVGGGTATTDDFTAGTGSVSFAPGDPLTKNASITLDNDSAYELSETFSVDLTTAPLASGINSMADSSTVTITNDDTAPAFSVTPNATSTPLEVTEGGTASFTVSLAAPAVSNIDFTAVMSNGSTANSDYTAPAGTFQILAGEQSVVVTVPTANDTVDEANETATLTIARDSGETDATGDPVASQISITDNDAAPTLSLSPITGTEGDTPAISATVTGSSQASIAYTATVTGVGGTAAAQGLTNPVSPADVEGGSLTLSGNLAAGSPTLSLGNLGLATDAIDEDSQTAQVSITLAGQEPVTTTVTIADAANNKSPEIVFGSAPTVAEEAGTATMPVGLSWTNVAANTATSTEKTITARVDTADDTATQPADYTAITNGTVTFQPGDVAEDVVVTVANDQVHEDTEQFDVGLSAAAGATIPVADAPVTVTDTVDPKPTYTVSSVTVNEGGTTNVTVELSSPAAADVPFSVTVVDGTATRGIVAEGGNDFSNPASALTVLKGQTTATLQVTALNDEAYEGPESAVVRVIRDFDDHAAGGPIEGTLTISDTDSVPALTLNTVEDAEGNTVNVTATPNGLAQRAMNYTVTAAGDTTGGANAAESSDFTATLSGTIPGGTTAGTPVAFGTLALNNDTVDEPTETVKVTAKNDTAATTDATAAYRITDDPADLPPSASLNPVTVSEGAGFVDVPVSLSFSGNAATSTEQSVAVTYQVAPGSATSTDFGAATSANPIVITGGSSGAIRIPIHNDSRNEPVETFQVLLTQVSPAGATLGVTSAQVTITDDDQNVDLPSFSVGGAVTVNEGDRTATIPVSLSADAPYDVDLTVRAEDGTATGANSGPGGDDYDAPEATLRIPQGSRSGVVTVPVRPDEVYEGDETARITVSLAGGELDATGAPQTSTLTIDDDDKRPTLALSPANASEGETIDVRGTVTGVAQRDLDLADIAAAAADVGIREAAEQTDYTLTKLDTLLRSGTPSGSTIRLGAITFTDDSVDEDTETVTVTLGGSQADYRITDDPNDVAPTVSISDMEIREGAAAAELDVTLDFTAGTTGTERDITVPWRTVAGTADAGADFTASSGTVRFTPPVTAATISVPLLRDTRDEADQVFSVQLGKAQPGDVSVVKATAKVTIKDDDTAKAPTLTVPASVTGTTRVAVTGTAGAGARVELLSAPGTSGGTWKVIYTSKADDNGEFTFRPNFTQGYRLMARSGKLTSPVRVIQVKQEPSITVTSTTRGIATIKVTGDPDRPGQTVAVQRLSDGDWDTVATGRLDDEGTFATTQRRLRSGSTQSFRAVVGPAPTLGILAGVTPARQVRIR